MAIINPLPNNLTNGTTADATQVMANFNEILNDTNTNAAHNGANSDITSITGLLTPLAINQGGTASTTFGGARTTLGFDSAPTSTGSANAQLITYSPVPTAYATGQTYQFVAGFSNTGATQININSLGLKNVTKNGATALQGGEIVSGAVILVVYDGTQFQLLSNNQREDAGLWGGTAGNTANVQTITLTPAPTAYYAGMMVSFRSVAVNTGSATLNVNGLGAKNLFLFNAALQGGEMPTNGIVTAVYDGTQFQILSVTPNTDVTDWGGTSAGTNTITCSIVPTPGAYVAGMMIAFKAGGTNTGATTLNVNSLGAKNVLVANAACGGGEIVANQVYQVVYDGTQFQLVSPQSTQRGGLIGIQKFDVAGTSTYTPTAGANTYVAEVVGAGGGGGGCATTGAAQNAVGVAGGGGGYARKRGLISAISGATITVGAKGTGGAAGNNPGTGGGTSSIGAVVSATGGALGAGGAATGTPFNIAQAAGGAGSSGDINISGETTGVAIQNGTTIAYGSPGGASQYGKGAAAPVTGTGAAGNNAVAGYGGGGSGGVNAASQGTGKAGGNGTDGLVVIWEYN